MIRQGLVEGLLASDNDDLRDWGTRIKNYSLKYEETQRVCSLVLAKES